MANYKIEGRLTVPTGGWAISALETTGGLSALVTIPAGDYYLTTSSGAATSSLCSTLATLLNASALGSTYTVALDDTEDSATGKITITSSSSGFIVYWTNSATGDDLRDVLGFTGDTADSIGTTATGAEQAEYLWLPNTHRTNALSPEPASVTYDMGAEESDYTITVAPGGQSKRLVYNRRFVENLESEHILGSKMWKALEVTVNESLQRFWEQVIGDNGFPIRLHPDRSADTVYWTWVIDGDGTNFNPSPVVPNWYGAKSLWRFRWGLRKLVS